MKVHCIQFNRIILKTRILSSSNIAFLILISVFIISKIPVLSLPYFWDEAWSYVPAITEMANKSPCLLPNCINPEIYRGHPLLFYFIAASWMKYIHSSELSMHIFSLIISILAIVSFYKLSQLFFPVIYSLIVTAILLLQEIFIVQSSFVLPEVLIMLLTIEALRHYLKDNYKLTLLYLCLLGLVKEIGILITLIFILFHIISNIKSPKKFGWIVLAVIPASIFYAYQKYVLGWFFYPLHIDLFNCSIQSVYHKLNIILNFIFMDQGRSFISILTCILAVIKFWMNVSNGKFISLLLLFIALLTFYIINIQFSIFITLSIISFIYYYKINLDSQVRKYLQIAFLLFLSIIIFNATNFLMLRYLLCLIPVYILLVSIIIVNILRKPKFQIPYILLIICISGYSLHYNYTKKEWHDDGSINYSNIIKVHVAIVKYCEDMAWQNKSINTHFLLQQNLIRPELKYLTDETNKFLNVSYAGEIKPEYDIAIFSSVELDESKHESMRINPNFKLIKKFKYNKAWGEVFVNTRILE